MRCEVFPLPGIEEQVALHLPAGVQVTVTASPRRGLEATLELSENLTRLGFAAVPHLSARLVVDRVHLKDILDRLADVGISEAFVIGGDPDQPVGAFHDALGLLTAMGEIGHGLDEIGITGYPEGHPKIDDDVTVQAMWDKRRFATYIVSQMCFAPTTIARWLTRLRRRGITLPVLVGVPGPVSTTRLLAIGRRIGVAESSRFLASQGGRLLRLGVPGRYSPDRMLARLSTLSPHEMAGTHVYTFNDVQATGQWFRSKLRARAA